MGLGDLVVGQAGSGEGEWSGDVADVVASFGPLVRGEVVVGDHVGDADPFARHQDGVGLGEHGGLVDGQVDHASGDHDVDRGGGQWDGFDGALEELDVGHAALAVLARARASISSVMSRPYALPVATLLQR